MCHSSVEPPFESRIALHLRVIGCRIQAMATGGTIVSLSMSSAWCRRFSSSHVNVALVVILAIVALGLSTEARVVSNRLSNYNYSADAFYGSLQAGYNSGQQHAIATSLRGSPRAGWSNFVKIRGHQFVLNGSPLYVNGANVYWLMTYGSDSSTRWIVDDIFQQAAGAGITVIRTWAFSDGVLYKPLQIIPGVYDEQVFQGLDYVIYSAKKHGIRMVLTFVNNYADYGGKARYVAWANQYAGASLWNEDSFYSFVIIKQWYKNHIKKIISRRNVFTGVFYGDETSIFGWELMNEPRCLSDPSGNTLQAWIQEMAPYVKSLDGNHVLGVGMEGFYSSQVSPNSVSSLTANPTVYAAQLGTDFIRNNQVQGIDYTSVHTYPDNWVPYLSEDGKRAFSSVWMNTHIRDSQYKLNKPVIFGEFGRSDQIAGYSEALQVSSMKDVYDTVYQSALRGGAAGGAFVWQICPGYIEPNINDGFAIDLASSPAIRSLMLNHAFRLKHIP